MSKIALGGWSVPNLTPTETAGIPDGLPTRSDASDLFSLVISTGPHLGPWVSKGHPQGPRYERNLVGLATKGTLNGPTTVLHGNKDVTIQGLALTDRKSLALLLVTNMNTPRLPLRPQLPKASPVH